MKDFLLVDICIEFEVRDIKKLIKAKKDDFIFLVIYENSLRSKY